MSRIDLETLARVAEGDAAPEEIRAVERAARSDESMRLTLEQLRAVLPSEAAPELPEIVVPETLHAHVLERAESAGIIARADEIPHDLHSDVVERLASEGLVAAEASSRPLRGQWAYRVAAVLLVGAVGVFVGIWLAPPRTERNYVERDVPVVHTRVEERIVEKTVIHRIPDVVVETMVVPEPRELVVERERPVESIVIREVPVEKIVERFVPAPGMEVVDASRLQRWDFERGFWAPIESGEELAAGTILRSRGSRAILTAESGTHVLGGELYVVRDAHRLAPVPPPLSRALTTTTNVGESALAKTQVPQLLELWSTGSRGDRSRAQRALETLWRDLGDGGGIAFLSVTGEGRGEPPRTLRGWREWWERVR